MSIVPTYDSSLLRDTYLVSDVFFIRDVSEVPDIVSIRFYDEFEANFPRAKISRKTVICHTFLIFNTKYILYICVYFF